MLSMIERRPGLALDRLAGDGAKPEFKAWMSATTRNDAVVRYFRPG
jgi:hypothetical protein